MGQNLEAWKFAGRTRVLSANADLLFQEARIRDDLGEYSAARHCLEMLLQEPEVQRFTSVSEWPVRAAGKHYLGLLWMKDGNTIEAESISGNPADAPM